MVDIFCFSSPKGHLTCCSVHSPNPLFGQCIHDVILPTLSHLRLGQATGAPWGRNKDNNWLEFIVDCTVCNKYLIGVFL